MTGQLQLLWFSNLENMAMHVSFFFVPAKQFFINRKVYLVVCSKFLGSDMTMTLPARA